MQLKHFYTLSLTLTPTGILYNSKNTFRDQWWYVSENVGCSTTNNEGLASVWLRLLICTVVVGVLYFSMFLFGCFE